MKSAVGVFGKCFIQAQHLCPLTLAQKNRRLTPQEIQQGLRKGLSGILGAR